MFGEVIVFWFWWVLAIGFLAIEILVTGFFFIWLAVSAFLVGLILLVTTIGLNVQLLLFSLLALASLLIWRRYAAGRKPPVSDHPLLNQRGAQYIGRTFDLLDPIVNGKGRVKVDGTLWLVEGKDCPAGNKIRVIAAKGTVLVVESCEPDASSSWE
ncbi:MAG: NfeD family protein [Methylococcales bacterium]|nr:NfeD family protein [Methylococcales bacterium]